MIPDWLLSSYGRDDDPQRYLQLARQLQEQGERHAAASAYDRAFGLAPADPAIRQGRRALLDELAVVEHGIVFRYIPAGSFLMGSDEGDPDEQPIHPVQLEHFWLAETPLSWAQECALIGWPAPPEAEPADYWTSFQDARRWKAMPDWLQMLVIRNKIRLQYCEDETLEARDWHAHVPTLSGVTMPEGKEVSMEELFGAVPRADASQPLSYTQKPVVAVAWEEAVALGEAISTPTVVYRLPSEAEWERAARGGLIGARYAWGDEDPTPERCDYDRFEQFSIQKMRAFPANGYGLYAMSGCVWEWTADWYDAEHYSVSPRRDPRGPRQGNARVLRGGSWADGPEAVTVSFRMTAKRDVAATIGMRLCRVAR